MARPQKCRCICSKPKITQFVPFGEPDTGSVCIGYDEYETIRLIDFENYSQAGCSEKMSVSRTTVTKIYKSARRKLAKALVSGSGITISGGDVIVCAAMKPECEGIRSCCHLKNPVPPLNAEKNKLLKGTEQS